MGQRGEDTKAVFDHFTRGVETTSPRAIPESEDYLKCV